MADEVLARLEQFEIVMTRRFDNVDRRFDDVDRRLDGVDQRLAAIDERLELVEDKVDRVSGVRFDADRLMTGFARLKQRVDELERRQG